MLGVKRLKVAVRRVGGGNLGEDPVRVAQRRRLVELVVYVKRSEPPAAGEARIFQDGEIELEFGYRGTLRARRQVVP